MGLRKVCWIDSGKFSSGDKTILFSGCQDNIHHDGTAVILDKQASCALEEWTMVNEHILTVRFVTSHAKVTSIQCCTLTNDHNDAEKETFYRQLQDLAEKVQHHDIILIMGDLNAKSREDWPGFEHVLGPHGNGKKTDSGKLLVHFYALNNMNVRSLKFKHKCIHKITWTSNDHWTQTQIKHNVIGPRWRMPCLQDVHVYHGADVCSDYHLAIAKLKVMFKRQEKKEVKSRQYDTSKLKNPTTQAQFQTFPSNRFSTLAYPMPGSTEWWDRLKDAMSAAGEEILGFKKSLKESWMSDQWWELDSQEKGIALEKTQLHL